MRFGVSPFIIALVFSATLHFVLGGGLLTWNPKNKDTAKNQNIEVVYLDKKEIQQIVEQEKSINNEVSEDAKYLSKFNQKVEKESKAQKSGKYKDGNAGQDGKFSFAQNPKPKQTKSEKSIQKISNKEGLKKLKLDDLKPKFDWNPQEEQNRQALRGVESRSSDYLKDVAVSNTNLLNTREFVYYTYFSRIKNQLQQYWEPSLKHRLTKLFRSGRQPASQAGAKITKVLITLNDQGTLIKVQVLENSGIRDLDEAAIDAFREAAPFPNPPRGIVESDGTIKIRWDFVLEA